MRCSEARRLISRLVDGELAPALEQALQAHAAGCESCRAELVGLRDDRTLLQQAAAAEVPPFLVTRVMAEVRQPVAQVRRVPGRVLAAIAAALLIAVGLGAGVFFGAEMARTGRATEELLVSSGDSTSVDVYASVLGGE
jgi:anti-sigma factor RsiW